MIISFGYLDYYTTLLLQFQLKLIGKKIKTMTKNTELYPLKQHSL
jgi:hypothetical protein